jgi:hypothetical protein
MNLTTSIEAEYAFAAKTLGDVRRATRMTTMLRALSRNCCGEVSEAFTRPAEQQGAYDWLEHATVDAAAVQEVASAATARQCRGQEVVYCILDGSSLALTDRAQNKGFGSIGTRKAGARGIKLLNALALSAMGQTIGVLAQDYWARPDEPVKRGYRPLKERESYRWHEALDAAHAALDEHAHGSRMHVLGDREADASALMRHMLELPCDFTIRANGTRNVNVEGRYVPLMPLLKRQRCLATLKVEIPEKGGRPKRTAEVEVRALRTEMKLRDHHTKKSTIVTVTAVWAFERRPPRGTPRLDWLLYTTEALSTAAAVAAATRYTFRWRIEELHKMLKSGGGCVEDSQLRSTAAVIKWATLHSIVASRAQRLRDLARGSSDALAAVELTSEEIETLVLLKTQEKRRNETVTADGLTIGRAVRWIGDLGGFAATGASQKMPGPTAIGRGLERVLEAAAVIRALRDAGRIR